MSVTLDDTGSATLRLPTDGPVVAHEAASNAFRGYVRESNTGDHVWFLPDEAALEARLPAVA